MNFLSNGQRQRLVIAKKLYWLRNEDILIFDECTSALDELANEGADAFSIVKAIVEISEEFLEKAPIIIIITHQKFQGFENEVKLPVHEVLFKREKGGISTTTIKTL